MVSIPLKNMKVNWDDDIPNIWKNEKCSKPPIRPFRLQWATVVSNIVVNPR